MYALVSLIMGCNKPCFVFVSHREGEVLADGSMESETEASTDALSKEAVIGNV